MDARSEYQARRYGLLASAITPANFLGLEIGACDLPTIPRGLGNCRHADFRSADEMATMWNLPREQVCEVDYLLSRERPISEQIADRFDYIIACHVLEHVPDPIGYLHEIRELLRPEAGGYILITLPDKRATLDATRPSTTIDRLLMNYYEGARYPAFDQVLEFHRHWVGYANGSAPLSIREAYDYAKATMETGVADAHCNVWTDEEFRIQCSELIEGGFLPGLHIDRFEPFFFGTNEFGVILRSTGEPTSAPGQRSAQSNSH